MCLRKSNKEVFWWFFISTLYIFWAIFASSWLNSSALSDEWKDVIRITKINATDPIVSVLQAINASTVLYALYFYVFKLSSKYNMFKGVVAFILTLIFVFEYLYTVVFVGYGHFANLLDRMGFQLSNPDIYLLGREYVSSSLLFLIFMFSDNYLSKMSADENEKAMLLFNSRYLSLPSFITLILCGIMMTMIVDYNPVYVLPFYAGIASCLLFTTNMIMALASSKWYASNLMFNHK
jgi:hypothetical protein